jgi:hypothetical protein
MSEHLRPPYGVGWPVIYRRRQAVQVTVESAHGHPWEEIEKLS